MLTHDEIQALRDIGTHIVDPINEYIIRDICERIAKAGKFTATADYMAFRAHTLGVDWETLVKEIEKRTGATAKNINQLYEEAAQRTYYDDARRLGSAIPFSDNIPIQQITKAAISLAEVEQTRLFNITQTMGMVSPTGGVLPLREFYGKTMDFVYNNVAAGAMNYDDAVRFASKKLSQNGVSIIEYGSGVRATLEAATRRNIMGGLGLMAEQIAQDTHDSFNATGWEISAHAMSAEDHEHIQGKQYSNADYIVLNNGLKRRIGTLHCGHVAFPIIIGVNKPVFTQSKLDKFIAENEKGVIIDGKHYTQYEATQKQRALERKIRRLKREDIAARAIDDKEIANLSKSKLQTAFNEYRRFSKKAGLRTQEDRIHVVGFLAA